jgi:hypothetical protein
MASTLARLQSSGFLPVRTPKTLVYAAPVDNEDALNRRISDACQTIHNYPGIFERMQRCMIRRVKACIESHRGHCEHLLQIYYFSYNSQNKCFQTHVNMDLFVSFCMRNTCPKFVRIFQSHPVYSA